MSPLELVDDRFDKLAAELRGARPVAPSALRERVRARMCSHLIACYGSTEANIVATAPAVAIADTAGAVGYVTPGVTVGIADRASRPGTHLTDAGEEARNAQ